MVQANAMDLSLFQFDYDLTFAVFLLNADRTIYGRYGSRTRQQNAEADVSMSGFCAALERALALHAAYPGNQKALADKQGRPVKHTRPEQYPSLQNRFKPQLDYDGKVAQSCMHCHQIRHAQRQVYRAAGTPIPDSELFPYPMPDVVGVVLDVEEAASVARVEPDSPAARARLKAGDELQSIAGQPLLSIADVQWILHHAPDAATLNVELRRGGLLVQTKIDLPTGWRRRGDIAWRTTSWDLRRMALGGLVLEPLPSADRRTLELDDAAMALRVKHVGQYGDHAVAKNAGFQKDDVLVTFDGQSGFSRETDVIAHAVQSKSRGDRVPVEVRRGAKRVELTLPLQ